MWYRSGIDRFFYKAFNDHFERIVRFSYYYCKDWEMAKDIAQETFVTLWQNIERVNMERSLLPYLIFVAKNKTLNAIKANIVRNKYNSYILSKEMNIHPNERKCPLYIYAQEGQ